MPVTATRKGLRGEWYLVAQAGLFLLLLFGPRSCGAGATTAPRPGWAVVAAGALFLAGAVLAGAGAASLGRNLTPLPCPRENGTLVVAGAYRIVRHPIYSGIALMAFGWSVWQQSWTTAGYALLLFAFFDLKSRREERFLAEKFPDYASYRSRVRRLIPFLY